MQFHGLFDNYSQGLQIHEGIFEISHGPFWQSIIGECYKAVCKPCGTSIRVSTFVTQAPAPVCQARDTKFLKYFLQNKLPKDIFQGRYFG